MGTGTSRGKKVAPARVVVVGDASASATQSASERDSGLFKPLRIRAVLRDARNGRAPPPDRHSDGHDSDPPSGDEGDADNAEPDAVLERRRRAAPAEKPSARRTFLRSRTYGLCHFGRGDNEEEEEEEDAEEPRVPHGGKADVNKSKRQPEDSGSGTRAALFGAVPENQLTPPGRGSSPCRTLGSSLAMPVILYDGSEEELMDTIEREFS